jgi:hypothetical protein
MLASGRDVVLKSRPKLCRSRDEPGCCSVFFLALLAMRRSRSRMILPLIRSVSACCLLAHTSSRKRLLCRRPNLLHPPTLPRSAPKSAALPMPSSSTASTTTQTLSLATLASTTMRSVSLFFCTHPLAMDSRLTTVYSKDHWQDVA